MPIKASAKKAYRQSLRKKAENTLRSEAYKVAIKKFSKLIIAKDISGAKDALVLVYQKIDKAAKTNILSKNKASRLKSKLTKNLASAQKIA